MVNNNLSFDECKQMSSRLIAMNPNRNANMGQIATYLLDYYTELTKQSWLSTLVGQIRDLTAKQNQMGEEQKQTEAFKQLDKQITALKKQLPFRSPHYFHFLDDHRAQKSIDPEAFTFQTTVDIDNPEEVEGAVKRALLLNGMFDDPQEKAAREQMFSADDIELWKGKVLHVERSARNKAHIDIRIPIGMTIAEAQSAFCKLIHATEDPSCVTPERIIFITDAVSQIYTANDWYKRLDEEAVAAYREAYAYALDRKQFGKSIIEFPAIAEIIALMRAKADASRSMLYETARFVDVYKALDDISKERKLTPEERQEFKKYSKLADAFTPMGKGMTTEYANQNAYDAIQVHGGSGFMKDYACERIYRDARITNIYEGTTQLQVVAAIRHVTTGTYLNQIREYQAIEYKPELEALKNKLAAMTEKYEKVVAKVTETKDNEYIDFQARRMVEAAAHCVFGYLLLQDANKDDSFRRSAEVYVNYGQAEIDKIESFINNFNREDLVYYKQQ